MSTPAAIRQWESHFRLYRTIWKSNVMASVVQPFLYLLGMGVGVGALVDKGAHANASLGGLTYLQFLGPALIATTAMLVKTKRTMRFMVSFENRPRRGPLVRMLGCTALISSGWINSLQNDVPLLYVD